jgi:eukaryotic-like serine/threonine-protein kinase
MGEVYLGQDTRLDRRIALKSSLPHFASDRDRRHRFLREPKSASALNHPNIITVYDIGEAAGMHFIAYEFVDGATLGTLLRRGPRALAAALDIAIQITSALVEAHQAGIVDRDLKPDNVMVRATGLVKLLDFGIARLAPPDHADGSAATVMDARTQAGMLIGTPQFMSPSRRAAPSSIIRPTSSASASSSTAIC